jgi:hypothetical protein
VAPVLHPPGQEVEDPQCVPSCHIGEGASLWQEEKVAEHALKTWPEQFQAVKAGLKTFELRKNDRDYQVGDKLVLCEYDPETGLSTMWTVSVRVTHILKGPTPWNALAPEWVIMSIQPEGAP